MNNIDVVGENIIQLDKDANLEIDSSCKTIFIIEKPVTINITIKEKANTIINCINTTGFDLNIELEEKANLTWRNLVKAKTEINFNINVNHSKFSSSNVILRGITELEGSINYYINSNAKESVTGINMHQDSKIIMLNDKPSTIAPNLLVNTEDLDASHGATIGSLDEDTILYLQSRGISKDSATKLIIDSYLYNDYFTVDELPIIKEKLT